MSTETTRTGDTSLLLTAVVLGAVISPMLPYVGLPIVAAGVAGLVYRDRWVVAVLGAVLGVVGAAYVGLTNTVSTGITDAVFVVCSLVAVFFAVVMLPRWNMQAAAAMLIGLLTTASVGADALAARLAGTTLPAQIAADAQRFVDELTTALGSSASTEMLAQLNSAAKLLGSTWPSTYFNLGVFLGVLVILAIGWSAKRLGRPSELLPLARLDLTMHVLWVFVAGVLLVAASYASVSMASAMGTVGTNLLLCVRAFLFLQGLSVMAAVLDKIGVRSVGRVLALAGFALLDSFTLAVSFTGLVDFWVNFRRLPRDGSTPVAPEQEASDR